MTLTNSCPVERQYKYIPQQNSLQENTRYKQYRHKANLVYSELVKAYNLDNRYYQPDSAAIYALRSKNICAGACGIGKTIIAGLLINIVYTELYKVGQIQIAAPNKLSASTRWLVDLEKFSQLRGKVEFIQNETQALSSTKPIWVYTVDFLKRKSKVKPDYNMAYCLYKNRITPSLVIIDEIHQLKANTARTKSWQWWLRKSKVKRLLGLSGTLTDGNLRNYFEVLKLVYGKALEYNKSQFLMNFGAATKIKTNYLKGEEQVTNISTNKRYLGHLDITKIRPYAQLSNRFIHVLDFTNPEIREVVTIPKINYKVIKIMPSKEHKQEYSEIVTDLTSKLKSMRDANWRIALSLVAPLIRAANNPTTGENKKLTSLLDLVSKCTGKTLVFVNQIDISRKLHNILKQQYGNNSLRLYAYDEHSRPRTLSNQKRETIVNRFLYDPDVKVGIFSINLASESIDLNCARQVIFYDLPWQAIKVKQAIHRAVRPGSPEKIIDVCYLYNQGMIDQHQYSLLKLKSTNSKAILELDVNSMNNDSSIIDTKQLIRNLHE